MSTLRRLRQTAGCTRRTKQTLAEAADRRRMAENSEEICRGESEPKVKLIMLHLKNCRMRS